MILKNVEARKYFYRILFFQCPSTEFFLEDNLHCVMDAIWPCVSDKKISSQKQNFGYILDLKVKFQLWNPSCRYFNLEMFPSSEGDLWGPRNDPVEGKVSFRLKKIFFLDF